MLRRHASGFRALLMLADGGLSIALLVVLSIVRFGPAWPDVWRPLLDQPLVVALAYATVWIVTLWFQGLYRPRARWSVRSEALAIARSTILFGLAVGTVLFAFKLPDVSRLFLIMLFPSQWAVALATRIALRIGFEWLRRQGFNTRYVLVVGAGARGQAFAAKLEAHRELGLRVVGFVDDEVMDPPPDRPRLGGLDDLEDLLHHRVIDEVAICLPFSQWDRVNAIAAACEEEGKIVRIPVDLLDRTIAAGRLEDLDGTPVYSLVSGPDRAVALLAKRAVDVIVATVVMILGSPLFLGVLAWVWLRDGRPIFFRQTRVGLHGRTFQMLKFRTMVPDAEARLPSLLPRSEVNGAAFKLTDDPRITPTGHVLRRTSLDELPQLWNVLRGDMSLVGPRPCIPYETEQYEEHHFERFSVPAGLTGLWQVTARARSPFAEALELDVLYARSWSFWGDVLLLLKTPVQVFKPKATR
jgi:exopolysaccharide biosynthesis polyprenyl glycosylphosphotransferase